MTPSMGNKRFALFKLADGRYDGLPFAVDPRSINAVFPDPTQPTARTWIQAGSLSSMLVKGLFDDVVDFINTSTVHVEQSDHATRLVSSRGRCRTSRKKARRS